jgi:hypothetical protein
MPPTTRRKLFVRRTASYKRRPVPADWRRCAEHPNKWSLWHRPRADGNGWYSFVLRHDDQRFRKYHYWGGWDGQRIARNRHMGQLANKHPEIYRWLERVCRNTWTRPQPSAS